MTDKVHYVSYSPGAGGGAKVQAALDDDDSLPPFYFGIIKGVWR